MQITPKGNFVLAKFVDYAELLGSKIIIGGIDPQHECGGVFVVVAVGKGKYLSTGEIVPIDVKPGDEIVVFNSQNHVTLPSPVYGEGNLALVNADYIVGVVDRTGDEPIALKRKVLVAN